jgi:DNA-binding NarL/FixJ family response regulator
VQRVASGSEFARAKIVQEKRHQELFSSGDRHTGRAVLTLKELQLLELLSYGYENGDIADHFQTSLQAVKNMLRTINLKLGADNRTHAVAICFRNDWLPLTAEDGISNEPAWRIKSRNR